MRHLIVCCLLVGVAGLSGAQEEKVGKRPYEMDWANRPPLVDFEDLTGWTVEVKDSVAAFERTREQQIWGDYVGKLTYRAEKKGASPDVRILPPNPIVITQPFDAVSCWVYGNVWSYARDTSTPSVGVSALFEDGAGKEFDIHLATVTWKEWFLCHRRLTPEQIQAVAGGGKFKGFRITNGGNVEDRSLYFDNLAVFTEKFPALTFKPRPERGIPMFPGQGVGTNTGPGKLPFPTRLETILPDNLTKDFKTSVRQDGDAFVFAYDGTDGKLAYRLEPKTGRFSDISVRWDGRGGEIRPCVDGGVFLVGPKEAVVPEKAEHLGTQLQGDTVVSRWRFTAGDAAAEVTHTYRLWNKSLVIDTVAPGGQVAEVRYGRAQGLENPRLVTMPYYTYGGYGSGVRPAVVVSGAPETPLLLAGHTDWTLSNASMPWAENEVKDGAVAYNGGVRYTAKTDGKCNDCFERFFLVVSPRLEEVLPTIPNPMSPWKHVAGTHVWIAHGAGNRDSDIAHWTRMHRYGMTEILITDHETGWRDGGESFTFRTRPAPGKGGDEGQYNYARVMQDKLGFVYGPYNNFTDFAPVNEYWSPDLISRTSDNQLQTAWMRCYAPKPARAIEYASELPYIIQKKFRFSTAYCDVHTSVTPWSRVDYDARVPGAGTFIAVFYAYGEIMLHQKNAWNGPVYSEGPNHFPYCGLTDGNYAQDQSYRVPKNPWVVDFDLRKMHDLCCNFGMGSVEMFYGQDFSLGKTSEEVDASIDRFLSATVAFGHPGFFAGDGGQGRRLRGYYMLQQLHSRYTLGSAQEILYATADGKLVDSTAAMATGAYQRSQVATKYSNGCMTVVNGSPTERMQVTAFGRQLDLPPNGYVGWTEDGTIDVFSGDADGKRRDCAVTPAYLYVDGRGRFARFPKAASNGVGICRFLPENKFEIIPFENSDCGFAIGAVSAVALDEENKELGPAELRTSRGLTYVVPVKGAFSYLLVGGTPAAAVELKCERDTVIAGEQVAVQGKEAHAAAIPADATPGQRVWLQFEGAWIDFTVVPLADVSVSLEKNVNLTVTVSSSLALAADGEVSAAGTAKPVKLRPNTPASVSFDLAPPTQEAAEPLAICVKAGGLEQHADRVLLTLQDYAAVAALPETWETGMCFRGKPEQADPGESGANAVAKDGLRCDGVARNGLFMHPPWKGGAGYVFARYAPVALPAAPAAAFRAVVGKGDGSYLGDGILYQVVVVDEQGTETQAGEQTVTTHAWLPIEADLSAWAGKTVRIKLVTDVGRADNSEGDWGCWADMRLESKGKLLQRTLQSDSGAFRTEPGPMPVPGLTVGLLRGAKQGWLHYDGIGLSGGSGQYGSSAMVNGIEIGPMAPAGGDEGKGVWAEKVSVPLTPAAMATLAFRNRFVLLNTGKDWFKVRRFWLELELADGRKCSSDISSSAFTQPPGWPHAEGVGVPFGEDITVDIWFRP